jgi:putative flippase GtrA
MVVGGICYIINLGVYYPLTLVYKEQVTFLNQVYYLPPFIASTLVAGTSHYFMNKYWTFGDRKEGSLGFLRFWAVLGPTVIFDMVIIFLLVQYFNLVPVIAASIAILSVFLVRYTIANKWIWGEE